MSVVQLRSDHVIAPTLYFLTVSLSEATFCTTFPRTCESEKDRCVMSALRTVFRAQWGRFLWRLEGTGSCERYLLSNPLTLLFQMPKKLNAAPLKAFDGPCERPSWGTQEAVHSCVADAVGVLCRKRAHRVWIYIARANHWLFSLFVFTSILIDPLRLHLTCIIMDQGDATRRADGGRVLPRGRRPQSINSAKRKSGDVDDGDQVSSKRACRLSS